MPRRRRRIIRKGLRWAVTKKNINDVPRAPGVYALYYYGKRRYVGQTNNLQRRLKEHLRNGMPFTEFTWYQTPPNYRHKLEGNLIDKDFNELWNAVRRRLKKRK